MKRLFAAILVLASAGSLVIYSRRGPANEARAVGRRTRGRYVVFFLSPSIRYLKGA